MKPLFAIAAALAACAAVVSCENPAGKSLSLMDPVPFSQVKIDGPFWNPVLEAHNSATVSVCIDQIENQTGRIRNFENAAARQGQHSGIFFDDSDVYKALEGMAYTLQNHPDAALEAKCDEWIDKIAAAQLEDGYINTYYTLTDLNKRWTDMDRHEMYCAGHMTEAAIAYYQATGKRKLLDVAIRMADYMMSVFGPGKRDWVPGHEEIELALVKLYTTTGERKYLEFADWLLSERGHGFGSKGPEAHYPWNPEYYQDAVPVREMTDISGHAVRSMYLYCAMADVASFTFDQGYIAALDRLWDDVVLRNMYITGGIGQSSSNEGFTEDYSLPNLSAYCETCASVGMVLWNWRMNRLSGDSKYIDILEKSLYNGALAGVSLDGESFFYVNPLESLGNHHRQAWYGCACCPSQICRFIPSIGNYIYCTSAESIWVNLFVGGSATMKVGRKNITLTQETSYPWNGEVTIKVNAPRPVSTALHVRIPAWCSDWTIAVNGDQISPAVDKGYAVLEGKWSDGDVITLTMAMEPILVAADPRVKEDEGCRALTRGPLVYCIEEADNPESFDKICVSEDETLSASFEPDLLGGVVSITASNPCGEVKFIPYYAWDNRSPGKMKVWVPLR